MTTLFHKEEFSCQNGTTRLKLAEIQAAADIVAIIIGAIPNRCMVSGNNVGLNQTPDFLPESIVYYQTAIFVRCRRIAN